MRPSELALMRLSRGSGGGTLAGACADEIGQLARHGGERRDHLVGRLVDSSHLVGRRARLRLEIGQQHLVPAQRLAGRGQCLPELLRRRRDIADRRLLLLAAFAARGIELTGERAEMLRDPPDLGRASFERAHDRCDRPRERVEVPADVIQPGRELLRRSSDFPKTLDRLARAVGHLGHLLRGPGALRERVPLRFGRLREQAPHRLADLGRNRSEHLGYVLRGRREHVVHPLGRLSLMKRDVAADLIELRFHALRSVRELYPRHTFDVRRIDAHLMQQNAEKDAGDRAAERDAEVRDDLLDARAPERARIAERGAAEFVQRDRHADQREQKAQVVRVVSGLIEPDAEPRRLRDRRSIEQHYRDDRRRLAQLPEP